MQNKQIRILLTVFILFSAATPVFSNESIRFNIEPVISMNYGHVGEYLYSSTTNRKVSYLEWQEKNLPAIGLKTSYYYNKNLFGAYFNYHLPFNCGMMTDSDWKIADIKTNYGVFNNHTDFNNYEFQFSYGYNFINTKKIHLAPEIQMNYRHYSFYSDIGHGWYGNSCAWDSPDATYYPKLSHIEFRMQSYSIFTGLKFDYHINKLTLHCTLAACPLLINYAIDYHADDNKTTNKEYTTYSKQLSCFYGYKTNFGLEYNITPRGSITTGFDFLATLITRGPTVFKADKPDEKFGLIEKLEEWDLLGQNTGNRILEIGFYLGYKIEF